MSKDLQINNKVYQFGINSEIRVCYTRVQSSWELMNRVKCRFNTGLFVALVNLSYLEKQPMEVD